MLVLVKTRPSFFFLFTCLLLNRVRKLIESAQVIQKKRETRKNIIVAKNNKLQTGGSLNYSENILNDVQKFIINAEFTFEYKLSNLSVQIEIY